MSTPTSGDEAAVGRVYDERAEAHYKLSEEIRRAPGRFTKDFIIAEMCGAVGELSYETQRLRATIQKTGTTASRRVEAAREREDIWRDRLLPQLAAATARAETAEAALETLRGQIEEPETEWTLGDEHGPYDATNNVRHEADVRFWANEPDSTSRAWCRLVGEWREAEEGGEAA